ncbi:dTDP-4-dehydrorhamnose 3,5-epimerase [Ahrensia sp. 13_GOM-1096m]|uniref:dTDP-4-dehydrorhamnose 3,5-epimerase n=1 Tax=Ahrensia sp. 13_GOM-1096m TaxID=1380380 RepID=UPI000479578E|nr:dTDP-4-dehydrorhamnose 3,5-epimerase [Ahrensia sp. 13_GOM-1096m]
MIKALEIECVKVICPRIYRDDRGFFSETYNKKALKEAGIDVEFVQDNHSLSVQKGVIRGLHYQSPPFSQGKLVRVVQGTIFDVAVDIRHGSPSFGRHISRILSAENWEQLWIPPGFAHGFCTLEANTEVVYKTTSFYAPQCDHGIYWADKDLNIDWPVANAQLSEKDKLHPPFSETPAHFTFTLSK